MQKIAVFHETHTIGFDLATWMLHSLGYKVYAAGESFASVLPNFRFTRYPPGNRFLTRTNGVPPWDGVMELRDLPSNAVFLDAFPETERALRRYGWRGPILFYWILPVGRNYIAEGKFAPGPNVAVLAFNKAIARLIQENNLCPVSFILPPYDSVATFQLRDSFEPFLITGVNKLVDWTPWGFRLHLARLRNQPRIALELYGMPPPRWATLVEHPELVARIAKATALYHVKPIDTPGYTWMEAAFQGVPVIFRPEFADNTEFSFLQHDRTCLFAGRKKELLQFADQLSDPAENLRIGMALRNCLVSLCSWSTNRSALERLLQSLVTP